MDNYINTDAQYDIPDDVPQKTDSGVFEELMKYVLKNGAQQAIRPSFKTNDFALYNADCLEIMSRFPDNYVDMIFADPPYMLSNERI